MAGWVKIEKDLVSDPRFRRMVKRFAGGDVTQVRISPELAATQLLGGLAQLWIYADTHLREDDTLDLGADEIDELVGIPGFAAMLPDDWLQAVDAHHVKLPDFQAHNGTAAKRRAQTAARVARHRIRTVTQSRINGAHSSNAPALPDLDQTRPRPDLDQSLRSSSSRPSRSSSSSGGAGGKTADSGRVGEIVRTAAARMRVPR